MSRKLDALVHERVFGRPVKWAEKGKLLKADYDPDIDGIDLHVAIFHRAAMEVPDYSTDIAAAWEIVERFRLGSGITGVAACVKIQIYDCCELEDIEVSIYSPMLARVITWGNKTPLAICLAALRAVGVPEAEIQEALDD